MSYLRGHKNSLRNNTSKDLAPRNSKTRIDQNILNYLT